MSLIHPFSRNAARCVAATASLWLIVLASTSRGQQAALQPSRSAALTADQEQILARAREILQTTAIGAAERQVRLQVVKATLTGTVIRPDDDYPEMRNPKHWTLFEDKFVVAPGSTAVDAIADLWVVHENDGVPIPRIRCYKYSSLILIEGYIEYFRETGNSAGLAALNRLLGHRAIPQELPNSGEDVLWKRRRGGDHLLPGDQVWVDNPFFDRGRELIRQEAYDQALGEGKSPDDAASESEASTHSLTAGEEGSNIFCLGDDKFIRGAASLSRLCRDSFQAGDNSAVRVHEQVPTPKILTLARFQEHMIDDNYTAQACLRADPASVRPADFQIERVRSPIGPENLLRLYGGSAAGRAMVASGYKLERAATSAHFDRLINAMASRNKPPRLVAVDNAMVPQFDADYDWAEQQRVRTAIEAVMRTKSDEFWWRLRAAVHDDRYVLTAARGGVAKNFTIGALCGDLVDLRLCLGFTSHLPSVPGRLPASFQPDREFWEHEAEWTRQRAPLYVMQAALCERAIQQWQAIDGTLPSGNVPAHVYTAEEKARYVAVLRREIAERQRTKKALYEEVIVPWLPAPDGWEGFDAQRAREARQQYPPKVADAH